MASTKKDGEPEGLDALIAALQILRKYGNPRYPTNCSHDELRICGIGPDDVSLEDRKRLDSLGFPASDEEDGYFFSFRFGSA